MSYWNFICYAICTTAIFSYCPYMTDTYILPKWLFTLVFLTSIGILYGFWIIKGKSPNININHLYSSTVILCYLQSIYAILQHIDIMPSTSIFKVVGSFDNPAGLAACISPSIPICIFKFCNSKKTYEKCVIAVIILTIVIALTLSKSRAGIIAGIFVPLIWTLYKLKSRFWIKSIFTFAIISSLLFMYVAKKDSADGRLLMIYCGIEMIKEKPIMGFGPRGIDAYYMNYQAKWLSEHPNSNLAYLADNVKSVFNEYLSIGICYGIVGLILIGIYIYSIISIHYKVKTKESTCAIMTLATIGVLSCFSYPLTYPFSWIIIIINTFIILRPKLPFKLINHKNVRTAISFLVISISSLFTYFVGERIHAEVEWCRLSKISNSETRNQTILDSYEKLTRQLGNEPFFLYNYAIQHYIAGNYIQSLQIAQECSNYWADYDLELLQGELFYNLKRYDEALIHYKHASTMCPIRITPLYKIYQISVVSNKSKLIVL